MDAGGDARASVVAATLADRCGAWDDATPSRPTFGAISRNVGSAVTGAGSYPGTSAREGSPCVRDRLAAQFESMTRRITRLRSVSFVCVALAFVLLVLAGAVHHKLGRTFSYRFDLSTDAESSRDLWLPGYSSVVLVRPSGGVCPDGDWLVPQVTLRTQLREDPDIGTHADLRERECECPCQVGFLGSEHRGVHLVEGVASRPVEVELRPDRVRINFAWALRMHLGIPACLLLVVGGVLANQAARESRVVSASRGEE